MKAILAAAFWTVAGLGDAHAGWRCDEPVAEWQPRETLQAKLETKGWHVTSIKSSDGCYKADATDAEGRIVQDFFNPTTLEPTGSAGAAVAETAPGRSPGKL